VAAIGAVALWLAASEDGIELGPVVWQGDWETGDLSQWKAQSACTGDGLTAADVGNSCITVVTEPTRSGAYAARFRIEPQSADAGPTGRAEVYLSREETGAIEGQEWYYVWSTLFPSDGNDGWWTRGGNWNFFSQFHNAEAACTASIGMGVDATSGAPRLYFELVRQRRRECSDDFIVRKFSLGPLRLDRWYRFVLRVRWSSNPEEGAAELWVDGRRAVERISWPTMHEAAGAYWKLGFYRGAADVTNTVVHDDARIFALPD
jgi:hypothetical protein